MEKNEGSPEKSSSEQDLSRERPRPPPSSEGSGSENLPAGGSSSSSNPPEGQANRSPVRVTEEMIRPSIPMATPLTPRPPPTRFRLVPARDNSGKGVVREPISGKTHSNIIGWPSGGPRIQRDSEFVSRALSSSWTITVPLPQHKRKGQLRELPKRQPRCATCGKIFGSWKALFGHLRSHPDREYRGAFPPPKASNVDPLITNLRNGFKGLDLRQQRELTLSLINAATVVSAMLDPVESTPENAMQIGEGSEAGTSHSPSERPPFPSSGVFAVDLNTPDENRRSLRNDGLELDLNAPPPDSDSEDENPKKRMTENP